MATLKPPMEARLAAFRERYESLVPFKEDRALAPDLSEQARPVLEALDERAPRGPLDLDHESLALLNLLGRRAGGLGATPSAALAIFRGIEAGLGTGDGAVSTQLALVVLEGYVAGRDERATADLKRAALAGLALLPLAPRVVALVAAGHLDGDGLAKRVEELERDLLRADARALLLDVTSLRYEGTDVPRLFAGLLATARSLGTEGVICGLASHEGGDWAAVGAGPPATAVVERFDQGLELALRSASLELRPRGRRAFSRLWRRSEPSP